MAKLEITPNFTSADQWLQQRKSLVVQILLERVNEVNSAMQQMVGENLSGGVLQKRSGRLLSTLYRIPAYFQGGHIKAEVGAGGDTAPYGVYFEKGGLGPYTIEARQARVLAFMGGDGKMIFRKRVTHPAIPKLPWFGPAEEAATQEMKVAVQEGVNEALEL